MIEIVPKEEPSERFRYSAGKSVCDPRLQKVKEGDTMLVEAGCIRILRKGREHEVFALNAFLWWHKKVFHPEFWRLCLQLKAFEPSQDREAASKDGNSNRGQQQQLRAAGFRPLLAGVDRELSHIVECRSHYDGDVIRVSLEGKEFGLFLAPRETSPGACFAELPSFAVCIRGEVSMSPVEEKLLRAYTRLLARRDGEIKAAMRGETSS